KSLWNFVIYLDDAITNEAVKAIICKKKGFFYDVNDLAKIFKPIKEAIVKLE
ncbi:37538_t:CDS:2, partial [Gigaspora margarita]